MLPISSTCHPPRRHDLQAGRNAVTILGHPLMIQARGSKSTRTRPLLIGAILIASGCSDWPAWPNQASPSPTTTPSADLGQPRTPSIAGIGEQLTDNGPRRPTMILQISFEVLRARVPRGFFSQSEKIWNHVTEAVVPQDVAVLLQRNGLRAAVGGTDSWPPIRALLEQQGPVETSQNRMILHNGLPLVVEPDQRTRNQTLFMFRPDGTLGGASFPQSVNGLLIEYQLAGAAAEDLRISVTPQVRLPMQAPRLTHNVPGYIDQPVVPPTRVFRELAFTVTVAPGQFVAIGPSRLIENAHLVGSLLLCDEREGEKMESMYFITPQVLNTGRRVGF